MNNNNRYVFWNAEQLAENLVYGASREYDFTFDSRADIVNGAEPCGWHGIKLVSVFDSLKPNLLMIGYWGGEYSVFVNLEEYTDKNSYIEAIRITIRKYFTEHESGFACVEIN